MSSRLIIVRFDIADTRFVREIGNWSLRRPVATLIGAGGAGGVGGAGGAGGAAETGSGALRVPRVLLRRLPPRMIVPSVWNSRAEPPPASSSTSTSTSSSPAAPSPSSSSSPSSSTSSTTASGVWAMPSRHIIGPRADSSSTSTSLDSSGERDRQSYNMDIDFD